MWSCPKCGEKHDDKFDSCWKCAAQPDVAALTTEFKPVFSRTGGARIDGLNWTSPFATLSADPSALHLSCVGREYHFPRNTIQKLCRHRGVFSVGLQVVHTQDSLPEIIVFWTSV